MDSHNNNYIVIMLLRIFVHFLNMHKFFEFLYNIFLSLFFFFLHGIDFYQRKLTLQVLLEHCWTW